MGFSVAKCIFWLKHVFIENILLAVMRIRTRDGVTRKIVMRMRLSDLKNEVDNIIKSRFEKFINSQGIVSREDFEALLDRHEKLNSEFNLLKIKLEKKTVKPKLTKLKGK